jgi:hypothetical protein
MNVNIGGGTSGFRGRKGFLLNLGLREGGMVWRATVVAGAGRYLVGERPKHVIAATPIR